MKSDIGLIQELLPNGKIGSSTMRVAFLVLVASAVAIAFIGTFRGTTDYGLIGLLLGYAYVGKGYQKMEENKPFNSKKVYNSETSEPVPAQPEQ